MKRGFGELFMDLTSEGIHLRMTLVNSISEWMNWMTQGMDLTISCVSQPAGFLILTTGPLDFTNAR